ncbi:hypothetical protein BAU23_26305 [Bacillus nitratireducens]|nr:hypothetical protein BAU23_26305 [Bacillus nitratireducens]
MAKPLEWVAIFLLFVKTFPFEHHKKERTKIGITVHKEASLMKQQVWKLLKRFFYKRINW